MCVQFCAVGARGGALASVIGCETLTLSAHDATREGRSASSLY
jgi:hypothetical protein